MEFVDKVKNLAINNANVRSLLINLDNISQSIIGEDDEFEKSVLLEREEVLLAMLKREFRINA